jgi:hypothetical protein
MVQQWARLRHVRLLLPGGPRTGDPHDAPDTLYLGTLSAGGSGPRASTSSSGAYSPGHGLVSAVLEATGGAGVDVVLQWRPPMAESPTALSNKDRDRDGGRVALTPYDVAACLALRGRWATNHSALQVRSLTHTHTHTHTHTYTHTHTHTHTHTQVHTHSHTRTHTHTHTHTHAHTHTHSLSLCLSLSLSLSVSLSLSLYGTD